MNTPTLLLTRPNLLSQEFTADLRKITDAFKIVTVSLFETQTLTPQISLKKFSTLIFTSANGVLSFCKQHPDSNLTAYCIGPQTTQIALDYGLHAIDAGGSIDRLVSGLPKSHRILYPRGEIVSHDLKVLASEIDITEAIFYRQTPLEKTQELSEILLSGPCLVPIFSSAAGAYFLNQAQSVSLKRHTAIAISKQAAHSLRDNFGTIHIANRPNRDSMITILAKLGQNPSLVANL